MPCITLSESAPLDRVGGKAANLAKAQSLGPTFVPKSLVLERDALAAALDVGDLRSGLTDYLASFDTESSASLAERHQHLAETLREAGLPTDVARQVREATGPLLECADFGVAVRSSAVYEDSPTASFAGVFESWVGLTSLEEVEARILDCWAASWSPRAIRYVARMGIEPRLDAMAVMIQEVVPARSSGVVYTADPDTGDPWRFVVRATPGLAIDLLSGGGVGDSFHVEWNTGSILERRLEVKSSLLEATPSGVERRSIAGDAASEPALTDAEVVEIAEVAHSLDDSFSTRLDIEFVFAPDGLRVVQVRPLTALPPFFPHELSEEDAGRTWQRSGCVLPSRADVPPGFITPLYGDMSEAEMWARYQPDDITLAVFCRVSRDFNGYRYDDAEPAPIFSSFFDDPSGYEAWLDANEPGYRSRWDRHRDELDDIERAARAAIEGTTTARELIPAMLSARDALWDLNSFGWSGPQSLGWMCDGLLGHMLQRVDPELETGPIVGGGMDSQTFAVTNALQELGRSIDESAVRAVFETSPLDEILPRLRDGLPDCEFLAAYEALCWRLGKTPPSWRGRPPFWIPTFDETTLMHTIRCALDGTSRDVIEVQRQSLRSREEREREVRERIAAVEPDLVPRFDKALEWTRYWGRALNDRHGLGRGLLWERELIWYVGNRLVGEGLLHAPEDVLTLRREDLDELATNGPSSSFQGVVRERVRDVRRQLRLQAPDTLGVVPEAPPPPAAFEPAAETTADTDCLTGVGIGHDGVTGTARRVEDLNDPALLDALGSEDVLVLPHAYAFHYADWHSLLTLVRGVVSPGSPSHHLAQVARECGVPVIAQVTSDLGAIEDGTRLHLDPRAGVVRVLPASP